MSFGPYLPTVLYSVCEDNSWGKPRITDQKNLAQEPSLYVNHYGQGLFEGIKAKKVKIGAGTHKPAREEVIILAPLLHFNRLNRGMFRLGMPEVPEKLFLTSIENFIQEIWESIPFGENQYLYVRPLARGIGEHIPEERSPGVFGNKNFDFTILGSPLHTEPLVRLKIHLEQTYTRTAKGGTGDIKAIGNYAAALGPEKLAKEAGYDQILWANNGAIDEFTTATCFIIKGNTLITPALDSGTILPGITRHYILQIARNMTPQLQVEERTVTVAEFIEGLENESITEIFTSGSAVTTMGCDSIRIGQKIYVLPDKGRGSWAHYFFTAMNKVYCGELNTDWVHAIQRDPITTH
jgi:branched-chain amino acid aminotransferase